MNFGPLLRRMFRGRRGIRYGIRSLSRAVVTIGPGRNIYRGQNCIRTMSVTSRTLLPAHEVVVLPALSPTMEVGTIKSWEVSIYLFIR